MTVFATCGHDVTEIELEHGSDSITYWWPDFNWKGRPAWAYGTLCPDCVTAYRAQKETPWGETP